LISGIVAFVTPAGRWGMRKTIVALLFFSSSVVLGYAECPIGSYPWVDNWGNQICRTFGSGQTTTIQGSLDNCPVGTHPWIDDWGNKICRSFSGNRQYYDTSGGCPIGTYEWTDNWGNPVCKRF
jgi:hypothetical protein